MYAGMYVCMCVCMYVCMYVRTYVRMYVCMYRFFHKRVNQDVQTFEIAFAIQTLLAFQLYLVALGITILERWNWAEMPSLGQVDMDIVGYM